MHTLSISFGCTIKWCDDNTDVNNFDWSEYPPLRRNRQDQITADLCTSDNINGP